MILTSCRFQADRESMHCHQEARQEHGEKKRMPYGRNAVRQTTNSGVLRLNQERVGPDVEHRKMPQRQPSWESCTLLAGSFNLPVKGVERRCRETTNNTKVNRMLVGPSSPNTTTRRLKSFGCARDLPASFSRQASSCQLSILTEQEKSRFGHQKQKPPDIFESEFP